MYAFAESATVQKTAVDGSGKKLKSVMGNNKFPIFVDILCSLCLGIGYLLLIAPFALNWFIHADYERYIWIINGPYPFSDMGSEPFQVMMSIFLWIGSAVFLILGFALLKKLRKNHA